MPATTPRRTVLWFQVNGLRVLAAHLVENGIVKGSDGFLSIVDELVFVEHFHQ